MYNVSGQCSARATEGERMKRLTERTDIGDSPLDEITFINPDDAEGLYNLRDIAKHGSDELLYEIANRLAEYEDMEEQGLLVRLPCKIGATVYRFQRYFNDATLKSEIKIKPCVVESVSTKCIITTDHMVMLFSNFGKTVFLTREEAEKALKDNAERTENE